MAKFSVWVATVTEVKYFQCTRHISSVPHEKLAWVHFHDNIGQIKLQHNKLTKKLASATTNIYQQNMLSFRTMLRHCYAAHSLPIFWDAYVYSLDIKVLEVSNVIIETNAQVNYYHLGQFRCGTMRVYQCLVFKHTPLNNLCSSDRRYQRWCD